MNKNKILDKVRKIEEDKRKIKEQKEYEQRCVKSVICPKCGNELKEEIKHGTDGVIGSWRFYICNPDCKYKIEVNNYKDKKITWRD